MTQVTDAILYHQEFTQNMKNMWQQQIGDKSYIDSSPGAAYMCQWASVNQVSMVQIIACHLFGTKPLSKPMLVYCQLDP